VQDEFLKPLLLDFFTDHRNDCISNSVAIICAYLGSVTWPYLDPIGAILVSIYILVSWIRTGMQQTSILTGRAASADYINRIIAIAIDHDPRIRYVKQSV